MPLALPILLLLSSALIGPADALPGKLALAYPVPGIRVDGDLSDWPDDLTRYPIAFREDGAALVGEDDFNGHFRIAYDPAENALYIAVEIEDNDIVKDGSALGADWNRRDGCELYLFGHKPGHNAPTQYFLRGEERGFIGPGSLDEVEVEVRWGENAYQYEWRVDFDRASGRQLQLGPEQQLGFDLSLWDRDHQHGPSWMAWSRGTDKYYRADRLGTLVLLDAPPTWSQMLDLFSELNEGRLNVIDNPGQLSAGYQMFFSGVLMAITFLHLLLFIFNRTTRANLFYALYTAAIGAAIFSGLQLEFQSYIDPQLIQIFKQTAVLIIGLLGLSFLYSLYRPKPPLRFWIGLVIFVLPGLLGGINMLAFNESSWFFTAGMIRVFRLWLRLLNILILVETVLLLIRAIRGRAEGAWIIGGGFILFAANINPLIFQNDVDTTALYWVLIPLISMSVYLARGVASTNRELETRLVQVEELSAKTQEQYEQIQEQNAQIQEANRLKSDFLARMAHDLRTPMNAIIGYTRILLRKVHGQIDERQYRNLENVQISANNLLTLINDILDLSKIEAGRIDLKIASVDLKALAGECGASVESLLKEGVAMRLDLADLPPVTTDEDRVRRILVNLLSNAVKFTNAGHIELSSRAVRSGVEIAVADTGIGIPEEDLPHIFDEFRQVDDKDGSRREGTGLGLAIVRKSAEMLGGTISVQSQEGRGSTFTLRLPDHPSK